jgi:hypothetical protein
VAAPITQAKDAEPEEELVDEGDREPRVWFAVYGRAPSERGALIEPDVPGHLTAPHRHGGSDPGGRKVTEVGVLEGFCAQDVVTGLDLEGELVLWTEQQHAIGERQLEALWNRQDEHRVRVTECSAEISAVRSEDRTTKLGRL